MRVPLTPPPLDAAARSGEVLALLLEREGAIAAWREMLGPGDPSVGRVDAPDSVRARWGANKQANAAHGADSAEAAAREIRFVFGDAMVEERAAAEPGYSAL